MSMVSALVMAVKAFKKNVAKEVAMMSGGEYTTFTGDKRFEQRVVDAAKHVRNRYLITFSPSDPTPGLHTIRVKTTEDYGARIVARANYWLRPSSEAQKRQAMGLERLHRNRHVQNGAEGVIHGNLTIDT